MAEPYTLTCGRVMEILTQVPPESHFYVEIEEPHNYFSKHKNLGLLIERCLPGTEEQAEELAEHPENGTQVCLNICLKECCQEHLPTFTDKLCNFIRYIQCKYWKIRRETRWKIEEWWDKWNGIEY